jgi:organic radical activating enzyme
MKFFDYALTFREMPFNPSGSITFFVGGQCKYNCPGCSWGEVKPEGEEMPLDKFLSIISNKRRHTDAICFLGEGDDYKNLIPYLKEARKLEFKTMLYTGGCLEDFDYGFLSLLNYIKVGRWQGKTLYEYGTNQKVFEIDKGYIVKEIRYYEQA